MIRRAIGTAAVTLLLAACFPIVRQVEPASPEGLRLVFEVTNRSSAEVRIGYTFDAASTSGEGTGSVGGCQRMVMQFGQVAGKFAVNVNGEPIAEVNVPEFVAREGYLVVPLEVDEDGAASIGTMRGAGTVEEPSGAIIPGCG